MLKELLILIYLIITKSIFIVAKLFPIQNKYVFVSSFGDNVEFVAREIVRQQKGDVVILKSRKSNYSFDILGLSDKRIFTYDGFNLVHFIKSIYHLATARTVFVDNYFAFLSVMNFKPGVECIQLWHAAGAVKKFGTEDPTFYERSSTAQKRFLSVYSRFDKVVVGSDEMVPIFKTAFNLKEEQFLKTGIPRTDFFFDEEAMDAAKRTVFREFPTIENKKVILYAPTFRRDQLNGQELALEVDKMMGLIGSEFVVLVRMHPAVKMGDIGSQSDGVIGVIDVSKYPNVNELLVVTDYLISDYSSLPYEFALLGRPQIFYPYDLADYEKESGFWKAYEKVVSGPIVQSTDEIIELIREDDFDLERIKEFSHRWNRYSSGESSKALIDYLQE